VRVCIVTPVYGRKELTRQFWRNLLYTSSVLSGHTLHPVAVYSDHGDGEIASSMGADAVHAPNSPLSDKANVGYIQCAAFRPDGVLKLDSDDFPSCMWMQAYLDECAALDVAHVRTLTVYDLPTGRCATKRFNRAGTGRWLSRSVLSALDWAPYEPGIDKRLDGSMDRRIKSAGFVPKEIEASLGKIISVKSGENIWCYDDLIMGRRTDHAPDVTRNVWKDSYPPEVSDWMLGHLPTGCNLYTD